MSRLSHRSIVAAVLEGLEARRLFAIAPGLPDATFAAQGVQITDFYRDAGMDQVVDVLPMSDGRYIAAGYAISPWWDGRMWPTLARYNADGSLDRTYGENGSVGMLTAEEARLGSFAVTGALMQPDGSVVLIGSTSVFVPDLRRSTPHTALLRYSPQGVVDVTFSTDGAVQLGDLALDIVEPIGSGRIARQSDGKLLVLAPRKDAGDDVVDNGDPVVVARLNVDGSLDSSFGSSGIATLPGPVGQRPSGIVVRGDGTITVLTRHTNVVPGEPRGTLIRLDASGSADALFGGGDGAAPLPVALHTVGHFTLSADGGYIVTGSRVDRSVSPIVDTRAALEVAKVTAAGALDATFGTDGIASHLFDDVSFQEADVVVQGDGKILIAGTDNRASRFTPVVARLNVDGSLDATFASQGIFKASMRGPTRTNTASVALAGDGAILVGVTGIYPHVWPTQSHFAGKFLVMRLHNPAATDAPVINIGAGTLTVRGTSGNDTIRIRTRADRRIEVTVNDLVESVAAGNVVTIHVTGGGGDDWIDARGLGALTRERIDFPVTIEGGDGNDIIAGSDGRDRIRGEFGNDRIDGGPGDDFISGNANHDRLHGGDGNDSILGAGGVDVLVGDGGDDALFGGGNNDLLYGSLGNDLLEGEGGNDKLFGDEGNDRVYGGAGHDTLVGGPGSDDVAGSAGNDLLLARDGSRDTVAGGWEGFDRAEVDGELDEIMGIEELLA